MTSDYHPPLRSSRVETPDPSLTEMAVGSWKLEVGDAPAREGLGVGLFSPKAMNNKAQGRFSAPWGRDRCPQTNLNEVLPRMCMVPLHTMECRFVVQPLCGWECVMRTVHPGCAKATLGFVVQPLRGWECVTGTCTQGALKRP